MRPLDLARVGFLDDASGIAIVEFAMVVPVFILLLMGGFDLSHTLYMQTVLQGTVQKASRDLTLMNATEAATQAAVDDRVRGAVRSLNSGLTDGDIEIGRTAYATFTEAEAATPEDANQDGRCEEGEIWIDRNFNGGYDADGGDAGQGGAKDVVVYSVTVSYPRLFPVVGLIGLSDDVKLNATTVLANQPYGDQVTRTGSLDPRDC